MLSAVASAEQVLWYNGGFVNFAPTRGKRDARKMAAKATKVVMVMHACPILHSRIFQVVSHLVDLFQS